MRRLCDTKRQNHAFTLMEVLITTVIASIALIGTAAGIVYALRVQQMARERTSAQRQAAQLLEEARRLPFPYLSEITSRDVLIDDNRTPATTTDDLRGTGSLRLMRVDGTSIATALGQDYIRAQARVTWTSFGRAREVNMSMEMAP